MTLEEFETEIILAKLSNGDRLIFLEHANSEYTMYRYNVNSKTISSGAIKNARGVYNNWFLQVDTEVEFLLGLEYLGIDVYEY